MIPWLLVFSNSHIFWVGHQVLVLGRSTQKFLSTYYCKYCPNLIPLIVSFSHLSPSFEMTLWFFSLWWIYYTLQWNWSKIKYNNNNNKASEMIMNVLTKDYCKVEVNVGGTVNSWWWKDWECCLKQHRLTDAIFW